jgi:hypothetical protein
MLCLFFILFASVIASAEYMAGMLQDLSRAFLLETEMQWMARQGHLVAANWRDLVLEERVRPDNGTAAHRVLQLVCERIRCILSVQSKRLMNASNDMSFSSSLSSRHSTKRIRPRLAFAMLYALKPFIADFIMEPTGTAAIFTDVAFLFRNCERARALDAIRYYLTDVIPSQSIKEALSTLIYDYLLVMELMTRGRKRACYFSVFEDAIGKDMVYSRWTRIYHSVKDGSSLLAHQVAVLLARMARFLSSTHRHAAEGIYWESVARRSSSTLALLPLTFFNGALI